MPSSARAGGEDQRGRIPDRVSIHDRSPEVEARLILSSPLFFVFQRVGFMLPGFHRVEPYANHLETASVTCSPASSAVASGCRKPQCIRSSRRYLCACCIAQPMDPFVLETVEPTLGWRVIPTMTLATHGTLHAVDLQLVLENVGWHTGCPDPSDASAHLLVSAGTTPLSARRSLCPQSCGVAVTSPPLRG